MRAWGRTYNKDGTYQWVEVTTDANGFNDAVYITELIQVLKLSLGESPFYAQYGIPAVRSVVQQVFPDYYVAATQRQFAPFFASLIIIAMPVPITSSPTGRPISQYKVNIVTNQGATINLVIPV